MNTPDDPDPYGDSEVLCDDCKRPLYEPGSRALGRGPVCRRGLRDLAHPPGPGQLTFALDLTPADPDTLPED